MNKARPMLRCNELSAAFSLVELLVVIAVIALLLGLSAPALVDVARGQGMQRAVNEISGMVEEARLEAMAMGTWTWLGLAQQVVDGREELVAVVMTSKDGTANMDNTNLRPLSRPIRIKNVRVLDELTDWVDSASMGEVAALTESDFSFSERVGGEMMEFSGSVLGFSPRGETALRDDEVPAWIEIGLRETRGEVEIPEKTASIRISGFSGQQMISY